MSIKITFNGATILDPGAYSKIVVENLTGFPLQPTGVVGIVGEALGGEPHVLDILSQAGIQAAKSRYKSGPISDALDLLVNGSNDPRIPNGASTIVVYKTNAGTQSAQSLANEAAASKIALTSINYGASENTDQISVTQGSVLDAEASLTGSIEGPFTLASTGKTLVLHINGVTYTYTCSLTGSVTAAALVTDLNNSGHWAPSLPILASVDAATGLLVVLTKLSTVGGKLDYGDMVVDASSTLETIIGVSGSARGLKGSRFYNLQQGSINENSLELGGQDVLSIQYVGAGTAALLSIQSTLGVMSLTTTVTGAPADDLNFILQNANGASVYTVAQLAQQINSFGGGSKYVASVLYSNPQVVASDLDYYLNMDIQTSPAKLRRDDAALVAFMNSASNIANASRVVNAIGAVAVQGPLVFSGGSDGVSANTDYANGFLAFQSQRINVVVPLISADAGSVTIDSVNTLAAQHAAWGWSTTGKSERAAFVSKKTSKALLIQAAQTLNSGFVSLVGQCPTVLNSLDNLVQQDPWALACMAASMRAGAEVGEPLTKKFIQCNALAVADGSWDPRIDYNAMIDAGVLIAEPVDTGGFRWVVGNTTYNIDESFVWNRESVVQAAGYVAYDLRFNLELQFTGTKAKTGAAEAIANFIKARMSQYLAADIIVGDDSNGNLGYDAKSLSVQIAGDQAIINVSITPVQGIDFILPTIYLANINQSA